MSDASNDIDAIREQKKAELKQEVAETDTPDEPVAVEDTAHFQELTGDGVVLVDFYADWCGPCKILEPTVEAIAAETDATVAKVDVDIFQSLAGEYEVQGIPTLFLFVDGEPVEQRVGVEEKESLKSLVTQYT